VQRLSNPRGRAEEDHNRDDPVGREQLGEVKTIARQPVDGEPPRIALFFYNEQHTHSTLTGFLEAIAATPQKLNPYTKVGRSEMRVPGASHFCGDIGDGTA